MQGRTRSSFSLSRLTCALAATLATACAGVNAQSPRSLLWQARQASAQGDYATLYALLPSSARRAESLPQFRARMSSQRDELTTFGTALEASLRARAPGVDVPSREGGAVTALEESGEGWRLASSGLGDAGARTPAAALSALRRALERQSLPALLRVLSSRARGSVLAEMATVLDGVTDPPPLQQGNGVNQRTVLLPDGRRLQLLLEGTQWRVHELLDPEDATRRE